MLFNVLHMLCVIGIKSLVYLRCVGPPCNIPHILFADFFASST